MTLPLPTPTTCHDWLTLVQSHHRPGGRPDLATLAQAGITPLTGGLNNTLYLCERDGRACCIKLYRTDGRQRDEREWHALTFLATHLPGVAPRPLHHAPDDHVPMVAMEYLPGTPLLALPLTNRHLGALAAQLRQLATLTPSTGPLPHDGLGSSLAILARTERGIATAPPNLRPLLARWLASDDPATLRCQAPPIFGLSDPNLANWLWDDESGTLGRVDLEYAGWSDLAGELASLIEGPWARALPDTTWLAFAAQFPDLDPTRFAAARRLFALFWVNIFAGRNDARLSAQIARAITLLEAS